jgi:GNAT superfamily N-acetyltransferase
MIETPHFRFASREDLPALLALYAQLDGKGSTDFDIKSAQAIWERIESCPDHHVFVAILAGNIAGTWSQLIIDNLAHRGSPTSLVENVVVDATFRGLGIGKAMMHEAMRHARAKGCYKLALSSNLRRTDAHRFYDQLGFERHGISFLVELETPHA